MDEVTCNMTPKEYLSQIRRLNAKINIRSREKEALESSSLGVSGFDYSKERVQTSPQSGAPFERDVDRIVELEQHIDKLIDEYYDLRLQIVGQIASMQDPRYIELLYLHYAQIMPLYEVSKQMGYAYGTIINMHAAALDAFGKQFGLGKM